MYLGEGGKPRPEGAVLKGPTKIIGAFSLEGNLSPYFHKYGNM